MAPSCRFQSIGCPKPTLLDSTRAIDQTEDFLLVWESKSSKASLRVSLSQTFVFELPVRGLLKKKKNNNKIYIDRK